jgi:hypothetical protein
MSQGQSSTKFTTLLDFHPASLLSDHDSFLGAFAWEAMLGSASGHPIQDNPQVSSVL